MPLESPEPSSTRGGRQLRWARHLLRLYPRAWQDRYGTEVVDVLQSHRVTFWTLLDLFLGALDAHLHRDLLPGRLTSMAHRIRTSEVVIFCAFVLFCVAWLPLTLVRDPLPVWEATVAAHPELLTTLNLLDFAGIVATLAVLVGGVPILLAALAFALRWRRWRLLALFCLPLLAGAALVLYGVLALPASTARASTAPNAPLTALAVALQVGLVPVLLLTIGGSTAAIAAGITQSEVGAGLLRFALVPAGIATLALVCGLLAGLMLTVLIFAEAPQVSTWPPLQVADLVLMLTAVALGGLGLWRGIRAAQSSAEAA